MLALYKARTANNAAHFLVEHVLEELPFPIQRVQTDRGGEFLGQAFQEALRDNCIKLRPVRPAWPHLNGKVERSQQTDRVEFWATADVGAPDLEERLGLWQHPYNWQRPHTSLNGRTPMDRFCELIEQTPFWWEVAERYDPAKEPLRVREYAVDQQALPLKRPG